MRRKVAPDHDDHFDVHGHDDYYKDDLDEAWGTVLPTSLLELPSPVRTVHDASGVGIFKMRHGIWVRNIHDASGAGIFKMRRETFRNIQGAVRHGVGDDTAFEIRAGHMTILDFLPSL